MEKINLINPDAVKAITAHVETVRAAGGKVSRRDVLVALGYDVSPDKDKDVVIKSVISAAIECGQIPGYKLVQKEGIVPVSYQQVAVRNASKVAQNKATREAERTQRALKTQAEKDAKVQAKAKVKADKEAEKLLAKETAAAAKAAAKAAKATAVSADTATAAE